MAADDKAAGSGMAVIGLEAGSTAADRPDGVKTDGHWHQAVVREPGLAERGNVFFAAVEMTRMPMILTDPRQADNPIVFANKAFLDLTGYEEREVLGRNCRFLQGAQTDREMVAELRAAIAERRAISMELLNYKRDGSPFWNGVFIGPVYDEAGELLYFFASQLDVTRRRNSEQAYRQAQKMESIGQLTAGLAHDFNNLLQVVSGNLEALKGRLEDPQLIRYADNAAVAADRGARLTKQLLAFARKTRLEPRPVDLSALVNDFSEIIESTLGRHAELQLNLRRRLPAAMVDSDHLEMALLNVLINARDAMPNGGLITIATGLLHLNGDAEARELPSGDYVTLTVTDEGEGMAPHVLERAAEPFFTTKGAGKGTGLGLAMANGFVRQSRGRLEIESERGRGTTIRMIFPAGTTDMAPRPAPRPSVPAAGGGEHILVVEDSPEVLELAVDILSALGYRLTTAASGDEALRLLDQEGGFDLVFTDLIMPGAVNGLMLSEEVNRRLPGVPVLVTTGYNEELVIDGPNRPKMDVVGKPYRRAELADRVRQALAGSGHHPPRRDERPFGAAEA